MQFDEIIRFVNDHKGEDPAKLRLKYHGDSRQWLPIAINNIEALKNRKKFQLTHSKEDVELQDFTPEIIPLAIASQQSTSANIALLHAILAGSSMQVLDMTFGLGMDARLMAMTPQRRISGFDLKPELVEAAAYNFRNFPNVEVRLGDSVEFLNGYDGEPFDLIFIDPARRGDAGQRLFNLHDCQPDLIDILPIIRRNSKRLMAKLSPMLDVTQTLRDLPETTQLHVVEENGECKELLAVVEFTKEISGEAEQHEMEPLIVIDRFTAKGFQQFSFHQSQERQVAAEAGDCGTDRMLLERLPKAGEILYEPSAATMKAAPFGLLTKRFGCKALAANSHIYISGSILPDFPGYGYNIEASYPLTSSNLKKLSREIKQADIAVRNLKGFTADGLAKKMRIRPGGNLRILGTTLDTPAGAVPLLLMLTKLPA